MSDETLKYVRKKCIHNKYSFQCKDCKGSQICVHNRQKSICKDCKGSQICIHNKIKSICKDCKGGAICEHNKRRSRCINCKGGSICVHTKLKSRCVICGGSELCEHKIRKEFCNICKGSSICEYNIRKNRCVLCEGSQVCIHNKDKSSCVECHGKNICEHDRLKYQCVECGGKRICIHRKRKSHCKICDGSALCKSEWCETATTSKYDGHCLNCFIHLFPDKPNTHNYKTKEKAVVDFILKEFPLDKYTWIADKRVQDGSSRKRPDLLLDLGYQVIIVEIDENQHDAYDCTCENKRIMELSQDVNHRPIIFIRFNPDEYIIYSTKITSCWTNNKQGLCCIKKTNEWTSRLESLKSQIEYWCNDNRTNKTVEIIQLFYNKNIFNYKTYF